jgi:hypothetical protein
MSSAGRSTMERGGVAVAAAVQFELVSVDRPDDANVCCGSVGARVSDGDDDAAAPEPVE